LAPDVIEERARMKRSLRSAAKGAARPLLGPLDRRLAELAQRQRDELERLDERLEIDLRILDEHLLAIQRATRQIELAATLGQELQREVERALADGGEALVVVAPPGTPVVTPDGFRADEVIAFAPTEDGGWQAYGHPDDHDDDLAALRITRLRRR
jgi:hypothetical protein